MLSSEDISKIDEIKVLYTEKWIQPDFLSQLVSKLKISPSSKLFKSKKSSGADFWSVLNLLLIFPFMDVKNIWSYVSSSVYTDTVGKKDVFYRMMKMQNINWRSILFLFVRKYIDIAEGSLDASDKGKKKRCVIFDDTDMEKRGKKIEGISKIFNHVFKKFFFGFKLLVAGYWDGYVFIPVDFSFHRESKKKNYGLNKKERKAQCSVKRDSKVFNFKRFKELNVKKTDMVVQMYRRINHRSIPVDYILFDSWFTTIGLIRRLQKINEKVNIIGMYKYNSKAMYHDKIYTLKQLRNIGSIKRSRGKKLQYKMFDVSIDGLNVRVFFTRRGTNGKWHTILSTDRSLNFTKTLEVYGIRWTIEVFFKEVKQLLGLGKSQSTNFDVQIAYTTIVMIQYLLISLKYKMEAYGTIGGLFKDLKQENIQYRLNDRIIALMVDISKVLEFYFGSDKSEEIISDLISYSDELDFMEGSIREFRPLKSAA
ncbi:MAG: transposase [Flavobacteriales bacterium]|nr:transposase [Flavobacteriales bacterium]